MHRIMIIDGVFARENLVAKLIVNLVENSLQGREPPAERPRL